MSENGDELSRKTTRGLTLILGGIAALGAAGIDMYLPSLPTIEMELAGEPGASQLTLSAFFVGLAVGQLIYGPASDALGRRKVLIWGIILYCFGGLACLFVETIEQLIFARLIQALGAAVGGVIARAIVRDLFSLDKAAQAQSFINLAFSITPLLAPTLGGYLLILFGWRSIFLALLCFGLVCLIALFLRVPETLPVERRKTFSLTSLINSYRRILSNRQSIGCILTGVFAFACMFTYFAASPYIYIKIFGVPEEHYGLLFGLNVIGIIIGNIINTRLVLRKGALVMLRVGSMISALGGLSLFIAIANNLFGIYGVIIPLFFVIGSLGFIGANAIAGALEPFPDLAGTTASLFGFLQMTLGAFVGGLVSVFHDGTALPMGIIIVLLSFMGFSSYLVFLCSRKV
ncbi:MAG: Bcr/CflA family drug resistance efflux transporter [Rhodospirillaceae bacterium]|nr:Bcr/CflA family drug resistance efflux transporter [Rhodospirillaceae bacterium]